MAASSPYFKQLYYPQSADDVEKSNEDGEKAKEEGTKEEEKKIEDKKEEKKEAQVKDEKPNSVPSLQPFIKYIHWDHGDADFFLVDAIGCFNKKDTEEKRWCHTTNDERI